MSGIITESPNGGGEFNAREWADMCQKTREMMINGQLTDRASIEKTLIMLLVGMEGVLRHINKYPPDVSAVEQNNKSPSTNWVDETKKR